MKQVIFYSWQSDLDAALTRNFIEDALEKAAKAIGRGNEARIEAVIDRDTAGVAGTPGITDTILQKIDSCDVFVCDVSTINVTTETSKPGLVAHLAYAAARVILDHTLRLRPRNRPTPNPNVLLELGYAAARIGWDRVILVQNTVFGDLEGLPFDLRGRRIINYHLSDRTARSEQRPKLRDDLETALRRALADILTPHFWVGQATPRWFGFWEIHPTPLRWGSLFIREVGATGFRFHLRLADGSRGGGVGGFAKFTGPDSAYANIGTAEGRPPCELKFRRSLNPRQITVEESLGCGDFKGMGATFEGVYACKDDLLFDSGALDELDLQRLYTITGDHYQQLIDRFQQVGHSENQDPFLAKVVHGGAKGLYGTFEAIIMLGERGQLWAAYPDGGNVFYFTTEHDYKDQMPKTFERWRDSFRDKTVVSVKEVKTIPPF